MYYISKEGGWFDVGTEAILIDDYGEEGFPGCGLFRGIKNGHLDEEICTMDEFVIKEERKKRMSLLKNQVYNLDCMELLEQLDDESVDCVLVDPPYRMGYKPFTNSVKKYKRRIEAWDDQWLTIGDYIEWCRQWVKSSITKMRTGAPILIFGSWHNIMHLKVMLDEIEELKFHNFITWFLPNAMPIFMAKKMGVYAHSCQYILYYAKGRVTYFDYEGLKEKNNGKQHRDLLTYNNRSSKEAVGHPTQKPYQLIRDLVVSHCPLDGLIIDFFAGSGTVGVAARDTGRDYILGEISPEYCEMIKERISDESN